MQLSELVVVDTHGSALVILLTHESRTFVVRLIDRMRAHRTGCNGWWNIRICESNPQHAHPHVGAVHWCRIRCVDRVV